MTTGTARILLSLALCACVAGSANAKGEAQRRWELMNLIR